MAFYTTSLSPGDFLPLFQLMDDYCDTRRSTDSNQSSRTKSTPSPPRTAATTSTTSASRVPQMTSFTPKFDVRESEHFYILDGELPGAQQENIDIEFTDPETMVIKGQVERNYDVTSASADSTNNDDTMSIQSDDASSTKSNYHSPTVEDEDETSVTVKTTAPIHNTVSSQQQQQHPANKAQFKYWASERLIGNFQRNFTFPTRVNQDGVKATFRNGILSVLVPKETMKQTKRIRIE